MLPYVILHVGISLDGRIDWGGGLDNPYYELVGQFGADADVSGSNTILAAQFPDNPREALGKLYDEWSNKSSRPIHAIVDSRGKMKNWETIRKQPWWRGYVSLCSEETPATHAEYLEELGVDCIVAGKRHVELGDALEILSS